MEILPSTTFSLVIFSLQDHHLSVREDAGRRHEGGHHPGPGRRMGKAGAGEGAEGALPRTSKWGEEARQGTDEETGVRGVRGARRRLVCCLCILQLNQPLSIH
jgi:hypothetical protein